MTDWKRSQSGGLNPPWPIAGEGRLNIACDGPAVRGERAGSAPRNEKQNMTNDQGEADRIERREQERLGQLSNARAQMAAALLMLDDHSHSPAAATLDLAIHYLDRELAG